MSDKTTAATDLRRSAEQHLKQKRSAETIPLSAEKTQRLLHELQVHQIELEMQNEELRATQAEAEELLKRYTDLYDFAPVGYMSLNLGGSIIQLNLAGARMLGSERSLLANKRFEGFVIKSDLPVFRDFLQQVFESGVSQRCVVKLVAADQRTTTVQIEAKLGRRGQDCLVSLTNISEFKDKEAELAQQHKSLEARTAENQKILQLMTGREIRMAELKKTIEELRKQLLRAGLTPVADD